MTGPAREAPDFESWLVARESALQRTAHLLTGDLDAVQDLVQNTLATLYLSRGRFRQLDDLDAHARKVLVNECRTAWRRTARRREQVTDQVPERAAPEPAGSDDRRDVVWRFVTSLPPRQRAVVVLRFHEQLTEPEIADLLGTSVGTVTSQSSRALTALLDHPEITGEGAGTVSTEDLLARTLAEVTDATEYPTTPSETVVARAREIRHRRRGTALLASAAALVVVAGAVAVVSARGGRDPVILSPVAPLPALSRGDAPRIDYLDGDTFVRVSGSRVTDRRLGTAAVATPYGSGVLVASRVTSTRPFASLLLVYGDGQPEQRLGCGTASFAVGAGASYAAYWLFSTCRRDGAGRLVEGTTSTPTTAGVTFTPVGRVSDGVVAYGTSGVTTRGDAAYTIGPVGTGGAIPHLRVPRGATPAGDLVSGLAPDRTDSLVVDATTGDVRWRLPGWSLGRFSPSGRYVVGIRSGAPPPLGSTGDSIGVWEAATGHEVLRRALPGLTLDSLAAWEGDDSVLVVAEDRSGRQAIIRVRRDGTVTRATRVAAGLPGGFRLASTP